MHSKLIKFVILLILCVCAPGVTPMKCPNCNLTTMCHTFWNNICSAVSSNTSSNMTQYRLEMSSSTPRKFDCMYAIYTHRNSEIVEYKGCIYLDIKSCFEKSDASNVPNMHTDKCTSCISNICKEARRKAPVNATLEFLKRMIFSVFIMMMLGMSVSLICLAYFYAIYN